MESNASKTRPILMTDDGASPPELAHAVVSRDTETKPARIPNMEIIARRLQALREAKEQQVL
jgi:hypothetical protein